MNAIKEFFGTSSCLQSLFMDSQNNSAAGGPMGRRLSEDLGPCLSRCQCPWKCDVHLSHFAVCA